MNEWQPIDTAPKGEQVKLGRWSIVCGQQRWHVMEGRASEPFCFGMFHRKTFEGRYFTHWQPLPPPPS